MKKWAVAAAMTLVVAGCGSNDPAPAPSPAPSSTAPSNSNSPADGVTVVIAIDGGTVTPMGDRLEVTAGEPVTLNVASDVADEIHVHSEPEHEFEVKPGDNTFAFTVDTPGQVSVESHGLGVTIVQLVVVP